VTSILYTIGFTGKTAEEFFRLLEEAQVRKVVDIRENRIGQLSGFAKHPDLEFFLHRLADIDYAADPRLAPSPEIRESYRASKNWPEYEQSFLELMKARNIPEQVRPEDYQGRVALLCSEPTADKCHRRLVAELLRAHWNSLGHQVEVKHLAAKEKKAQRAPRGPRTPVV
jgi:uncharacterized protein (DUF488 family)